jgi:hypothetical protein
MSHVKILPCRSNIFSSTYLPKAMTTENKIVHILRHAAANDDDAIFDPPLSSNGAYEATKLIENLPSCMKAPTLVLAPPLKRCMETALRAFHPRYNYLIRHQPSKNTLENTKCNELMDHFANGNVTFMLDPRLQDATKEFHPGKHKGRIGMPSRREMHSGYRRHFIFPEEFYPKYAEDQDDDPDEQQDWYTENGMWAGNLRCENIESLERAASFKEFLYNRPEKEIIVITCEDFGETLIDHGLYHFKVLSFIWKPTVSGRIRLVNLTCPEAQKNIVKDHNYSSYWPYSLPERSELFKKWHREPSEKIIQYFFGIEERKKYLGLDKLTFDDLEAELGPEVVKEVKDRVSINTNSYL